MNGNILGKACALDITLTLDKLFNLLRQIFQAGRLRLCDALVFVLAFGVVDVHRVGGLAFALLVARRLLQHRVEIGSIDVQPVVRVFLRGGETAVVGVLADGCLHRGGERRSRRVAGNTINPISQRFELNTHSSLRAATKAAAALFSSSVHFCEPSSSPLK